LQKKIIRIIYLLQNGSLESLSIPKRTIRKVYLLQNGSLEKFIYYKKNH